MFSVGDNTFYYFNNSSFFDSFHPKVLTFVYNHVHIRKVFKDIHIFQFRLQLIIIRRCGIAKLARQTGNRIIIDINMWIIFRQIVFQLNIITEKQNFFSR